MTQFICSPGTVEVVNAGLALSMYVDSLAESKVAEDLTVIAPAVVTSVETGVLTYSWLSTAAERAAKALAPQPVEVFIISALSLNNRSEM
ncbi:hypothetical protein ACK31I_13770 [Aeromonas caviae]